MNDPVGKYAKMDREDQQVNVHVQKYRGQGARRPLVIRGLETFRDLAFQEKFAEKPTQEEYRSNSAAICSSKSLTRKVLLDGIPEADARQPPRLARVEDMLLKQENAVFKLTLHLPDPIYGCSIPFRRVDEHVFVRPAMYYQKLDEFYRAKEVADRDNDRTMTAAEFWVPVLHESFSTEDACIGYCNMCLRMFYAPMTKQYRLPLCQDCFGKIVEDRCTARENRVTSEVTGHIVGLSTDEELRTFSDDVARTSAPRGEKRKRLRTDESEDGAL